MKEAVAVVWVHDPFLCALPPPRAAATFLPHLPTAAAAASRCCSRLQCLAYCACALLPRGGYGLGFAFLTI